MTRQHLLDDLRRYQPDGGAEQQHYKDLINLLLSSEDCFFRSRQEGHITASAWVVLPASQKVLLMHHRKLDRWLQPGGHADGDENLAGVALREAHEESGLCSLRLLKPQMFDVDVHTIPARPDQAEHLHYDVRYLLTADPRESLNPDPSESKGFEWIAWNRVSERVQHEASILRLLQKTENLYLVSA